MSDPADSDMISLAATLIIMRESNAGAPELLVLERASTMAFAPGALVFPGGQVEAGDLELADTLSSGTADERLQLAQRIAAIRETIEEAGIAAAIDPPPTSDAVDMVRRGLAEGRSLGSLLEEMGACVDLGALTLFARWWPPRRIVRRFDTRFFLAKAPLQALESVDGQENVRALWSQASTLLADVEAGHHHVIFPTWCTLQRLAQFSSFDDARADGLRYGHHLATGHVHREDDEDWLCVPKGIGYPVTRRLLSANERG